MISSIFGKTKPINFIIVLSFLFVFYWVVHFFLFEQVYDQEQLIAQVGVLALLMFCFFIADFIIKRNKMTANNSYTILFLVLLMVVFPETLLDNNVILCSFFILLATRRLISLRSLKDIKFKIFDATLWIMFSSLFFDWSLLFLLVVFAAIYIYDPKSFRNWLVPFAAILAMALSCYGFLVLTGNESFFMTHYQFQIHGELAYYMNWANSSKLIIYCIFVFMMMMYSFLKLGNTGVGKIVTTRLLVLLFIIGLTMNILLSSEKSAPILLTFFPTAVLFTNYVESLKRSKVKEIVLLFSIFVPIIVFLSILILK